MASFTLTEDDRRKLTAIIEEQDPLRWMTLVHEYYRDADRADRTPRPELYFHLGLACGIIMRLLGDKKKS